MVLSSDQWGRCQNDENIVAQYPISFSQYVFSYSTAILGLWSNDWYRLIITDVTLNGFKVGYGGDISAPSEVLYIFIGR